MCGNLAGESASVRLRITQESEKIYDRPENINYALLACMAVVLLLATCIVLRKKSPAPPPKEARREKQPEDIPTVDLDTERSEEE